MHAADLADFFRRVLEIRQEWASEDLTAILWPGLWHEIFNEPRQAEVLSTMAAWIRARVS